MKETTKVSLNNGELNSNDENSDITKATQSSKDAEGMNSDASKKKWYDYLIQIISAITSLLAMIAGFKKYTYSLNAENYYGIPHKYFENSLTSELIFIIVFAVLMLAINFIPLILKYYNDKKTFKITRFDSILYPILMGLCNFYILYIFVVGIFNITGEYQAYIALACLAISILLGIFANKVLKRINLKNNIEYEALDNKKKNKSIEDLEYTKDLQNYLFIAIAISLIVLFLFFKRFSYDPSERKDYEFFNDQNGKGKIIIDNYNEKSITMDYYEILNENTFAIRQNNFKIQNVEEKEIEFKHIGPLYNKTFSKLTLDLNGGKFKDNLGILEYAVVKNYKISELEKLVNNLFTDSKPSKNGRNLLYWSATEDGEFNYFKDSTNKLFDLSSDIILYAQYKDKVIDDNGQTTPDEGYNFVIFNFNGGKRNNGDVNNVKKQVLTGVKLSDAVKYVEDKKLTDGVEKAGKAFGYWSDAQAGDSPVYTDVTVDENYQDKTLYAQYKVE
ncbi:InlB B-repeat-containing protein [uncultured Fenollaria sp.]|uniref:InlB B-repeat-containing protein n=1 Tax=uncultured Fenollaria sp. TaxID=1686315 RepID=UPI0025CC7371|nr:hypothetical protein [uncultured Fenollaria sp.]